MLVMALVFVHVAHFLTVFPLWSDINGPRPWGERQVPRRANALRDFLKSEGLGFGGGIKLCNTVSDRSDRLSVIGE